MAKTRAYLELLESDVVEDMTRYIGYAGESQGDFTSKYHWFRAAGRIYYARPKGVNTAWDRGAVERYASFGKKTKMVRIQEDEYLRDIREDFKKLRESVEKISR